MTMRNNYLQSVDLVSESGFEFLFEVIACRCSSCYVEFKHQVPCDQLAVL